MCLGIDRAQYVKSFSTRRGRHKKTVPKPQIPQERRPDKMRGIDKKHLPAARPHFLQPWPELLFYGIFLLFLAIRVGLSDRDGAGFAAVQPDVFFKNLRTAVLLRFMPVFSSIRCPASLMLAGGLSAIASSILSRCSTRMLSGLRKFSF